MPERYRDKSHRHTLFSKAWTKRKANAAFVAMQDPFHAFLDTMEQPIKLRRNEVQLPGSFGVASYPNDGETVDDLIRAANQAMYRRKHSSSHLMAAGT